MRYQTEDVKIPMKYCNNFVNTKLLQSEKFIKQKKLIKEKDF